MKSLYLIAKKHNIKLTNITLNDKHCKSNGEDYYINKSYSAGRKIWLGVYENSELKTISFFHELGHCVGYHPNDYTNWLVYDIEKLAWKEGLKIAQLNGYSFSKKTMKWAVQQLHTYIGWEEREERK